MSVENPASSAFWVQPRWVEHFGSRMQPTLPWRFFASDGCQHGQISPGIYMKTDKRSLKARRGWPITPFQSWNYAASSPFYRCLAAFTRTAPFSGRFLLHTGSVSTAAYSGRYPAPLCLTIARSAQAAMSVTFMSCVVPLGALRPLRRWHTFSIRSFKRRP